MIPIARPVLGHEEKQAVLAVLDSGMLAQGPRVRELEVAFAEMSGTRFAVATSSGTTALHTALLAHGIGEGDEVITSPFTFIASANSIRYTGAQPVFVDIDAATFNIDPALIEAAITPRTRAIMPVHLFGLCCEMETIMAIAARHNLIVIEDACQSHGARRGHQMAGSWGTGVFSFYPTKNMTTAEGGMITTDDESFAECCRLIRNHGMVRRYFHDEMGFNFRMTDIHAAIGLEQLRKLPRFNEARQATARYFNERLAGSGFLTLPDGRGHVYHQYTVRAANGKRDALRSHLQARGVGSGIYYPLPVHKQRAFRELLGDDLHLPVAEMCAQEVLSLPVYPGLRVCELEQIVTAVVTFEPDEYEKRVLEVTPSMQ